MIINGSDAAYCCDKDGSCSDGDDEFCCIDDNGDEEFYCSNDQEHAQSIGGVLCPERNINFSKEKQPNNNCRYVKQKNSFRRF